MVALGVCRADGRNCTKRLILQQAAADYSLLMAQNRCRCRLGFHREGFEYSIRDFFDGTHCIYVNDLVPVTVQYWCCLLPVHIQPSADDALRIVRAHSS